MTIEERKMDLFKMGEEYQLAHCISSDCSMGSGIALGFQKHFPTLKHETMQQNLRHPRVVQVGRVFNLVTKPGATDKPGYGALLKCLYLMHDVCIEQDITKLAIPRIGCDHDGLNWRRVKSLIIDVFQDTHIEIVVCYL